MMFDVSINNENPGLLESEIQDLEQDLHFEIPGNYREFLMRCDGASVTAGELKPVADVPGYSEITLAFFYSYKHFSEPYLSLIERLLVIVDAIGNWSIPIAADNLGNDLLLNCKTGELEFLICDPRDENWEIAWPTGVQFSDLRITA